MAKKIKITWMKSDINQQERHKKTIKALGLKRLRHSVVKTDSPSIRGMVYLVNSLVSVEEVKG